MKEYSSEELQKLHEVELSILKDFDELCTKHNLTYFGIAGTCIGTLRHKGFIPWDDDIDVGMPRKDYEKFLKIVKDEYADKYTAVNTESFPNYPLMSTRLTKNGTVFREEALKNIDCFLGIFLDIFPFDNISDDDTEFKKQGNSAWLWSKLLILRSIPHPYLAFKGAKAAIVQFICACIHYIMVIFRIKKSWIYKKCIKVCKRYNYIETKRMAFLCDTSAFANVLINEEIYPIQKLQFEDMMVNFPNDMHPMLTKMYGDYMQLPPVEKRKNHHPLVLDFAENE